MQQDRKRPTGNIALSLLLISEAICSSAIPFAAIALKIPATTCAAIAAGKPCPVKSPIKNA